MTVHTSVLLSTCRLNTTTDIHILAVTSFIINSSIFFSTVILRKKEECKNRLLFIHSHILLIFYSIIFFLFTCLHALQRTVPCVCRHLIYLKYPAFTSGLLINGAIKIAKTILIRSPGINGTTPAIKAACNVICASYASHAVPSV